MNSKTIAQSALASVIALGLLTAAGQASAADKEGAEKCYGVVKASKNDCAAKGHACAGQATKDGASDEWVYLPKGACEKIVGGSLTAKS
jgi:uncharacterized membrane protein